MPTQPIIRAVFLSSTSKDLSEYRKAVREAINKLKYYKCVWMEDFGAVDQAPLEYSRQEVAECDVFVGIVGHCYGSCPKGSNKSFSEHEYDMAVTAGKPRLMFFAPDDFPVPADQIGSMKRYKQKAFRKKIGQERIYDIFTTPEILAERVVQAIHNWEWQEKEMRVREQEKKRIRREIHDSAFGALLLLREVAEDALTAGDHEMRNALADVASRAMKIYNELAIAMGMLTEDEAVEEEEKERTESFIRDLEKICTDGEKVYKLKIHRDFRPDVVKLIPPKFLLDLRKVLNGQLHNVWEHAEATKVRVTLEPDRPLRKTPRLIRFTISDNGKGCDFSWDSLSPNQLGLVGAREGMKKMGGSLEVYSAPGQGFTLIVGTPLT